MRQRHNKFENTPYALEPNCKESPGGLRDLQVVLWVARAAGLGKSWDDLAKNGLVTTFEARQIKANEALLSLIRARLHLISGRREDRLVFDLQTAVAESFGYSATGRRWQPAAAPRQRSADAPLLLGRQGRHAAQPDPAAQHRGAAQPLQLPAAPHQRALFRQGRHAGGGQRRPVPARSARHPGNLFAVRDHHRHQGPVGAHPARAVQRPRRDERASSAPTRSTARPSCTSCSSPKASRTPCG